VYGHGDVVTGCCSLRVYVVLAGRRRHPWAKICETRSSGGVAAQCPYNIESGWG
jgi:hypothetical protein